MTARFWNKVDVRGPDECWPWLAAKDYDGYGKFVFNGKMTGAHRLALELSLGRPLLPGMVACHRPNVCHNPACCNPAHLYEGTQQQNVKDRDLDGTSNRGVRNGQSKLTEEMARQLLKLKGRLTTQAAGERFGVDRRTVGKLWRGKAWKHLERGD